MTQFILSCTTCSTRMPYKDEIAECFTHAPPAGYTAWGVAGPACWTPGLSQWIDFEAIGRKAQEAGLVQCTEVYCHSFPTSSVAAAQAAATQTAMLFGVAETLGSPLVVLSGGKRVEGGLDATIAGIEALLPLIGDSPVRLALEPHYGSQIQFLEDYDAIFARIQTPQVGITVDSGHFHSAGVDWRTLVDRYADRIYNFHVKDHIGTQSMPLGTGEIDLKAYLEALDAIDYEGALAIELEVADLENLPQYVGEAYVYMRRLVDDVMDDDIATQHRR